MMRAVLICPACSREYSAERTHCERDGVMLIALAAASGGRPEELLGATIDGRYRVDAIIGRGGMGTVYSCRHVVVGKPCAMKVLRAGIEQSSGVLQRFIHEAQATNSVRSRHIVQMSDFGQLPTGQFYMVMELLVGRDLAKALRATARAGGAHPASSESNPRILAPAEMLHIFIQVAEALDATHREGIVHRDLKPDNVFLVQEEDDPLFVKILDFGIAKALHAGPSGLTETGVILGTPYYMSPEQARGEQVDHRTDIYSLGVIMYRAFTGKLPFYADSAIGVLTRHMTEAPAPPSRIAGVDPLIEEVILRCMEKRREDRYQSMRAVAEALRAIRRGERPAMPREETTTDERGALHAYTSTSSSVLTPGSAAPAAAPAPGPSLPPQAEWTSRGLATSSALRAQPPARRWPLIVGAIAMVGLGGAIAVIAGSLARSAGGDASPATPPSPSATAASSAALPSAAPSLSASALDGPGAAPTTTATAAPTATVTAAPAATTARTVRGGGVRPPAAGTSTSTRRNGEIRSPFD